MRIFEKKSKLFSVAVAVLFIAGLAGLTLMQTNVAQAANQTVGVVIYQQLMAAHPDTAKAQEALNAAAAQAKSDFDAKAASMNDQEKEKYYQELQQGLMQKQQSLFMPIYTKVDAAVKAVADEKGLVIVIDKSNTVYGGLDITEDVKKKF